MVDSRSLSALQSNAEIDRARSERIRKLGATFVAGGLAGCTSKTAVAPLDRVKILLQAHNRHYKHLGVFSAGTQIVKREGFVGLYRGNGAQMVRIFPYAAIQFLTYEQYKKALGPPFGDHPHVVKLVSGSLAGLTAVLLTYPLDVVRARLAFQSTGEHIYTGVLHALQSMAQHEGGVRALYRGIVPTVLGMVPYAGLSFYFFETLKELCLTYFPGVFGKPSPHNPNAYILTIPAKLVCGGAAGAVAQTLSYPLDVARRKMQLARMLPDQHMHGLAGSWTATLRATYREHGVRRGLYRGLSVNYIRVVPMVAVSFSTFETLKQLFKLDTSVDVGH